VGKSIVALEKWKMFSGKTTIPCTDIGITNKDALLMDGNWLL